MEQLERAMAMLEDWVARGRNVKEEVEEVVEEETLDGTDMAWLREYLENPGAGANMDMPWDGAILEGPRPPRLDTLVLLPSEIPVCTLFSVMHRVHHNILGQGRWVWVAERGVHTDKPLQVGGVPG